MTSYLLDILPAEIRCEIFEEVIKAQRILPLQSEVFRSTTKKRYQVQSPFHNLLRVNKQMRAEVQACLFKVSDTQTPRKVACTMFDITRDNKVPLVKSRMQFRIEFSTEVVPRYSDDLVYAQLGVFDYNYRSHYFTYLGDMFWPGKIDRKLERITLGAPDTDLVCRRFRNKRWHWAYKVVDIEDVAAAMGWDFPGYN